MMQLRYADRYRIALDLWLSMNSEQQRPFRASHRRLRERLQRNERARRTASSRQATTTLPPSRAIEMRPQIRISGEKLERQPDATNRPNSDMSALASQVEFLEYALRAIRTSVDEAPLPEQAREGAPCVAARPSDQYGTPELERADILLRHTIRME